LVQDHTDGIDGSGIPWVPASELQQGGFLVLDLKIAHELHELRLIAGLVEQFENRSFYRRIVFEVDAFETLQRFKGDSGSIGVCFGQGSKGGFGIEAPSSNNQHPERNQTPTSKKLVNTGILELGFWSFSGS